jgi:hypothetical protein
MAEKVGIFNELYISSAASDAAYTELEFIIEGTQIGLNEQFLDSAGGTGSRSRPSERVRRGIRAVQGQLVFQPSPLELDILLPWALGGSKSTNTIPLAETVPARWLRTRRDDVWHTYDNCKVDQITFSANEGSPLVVSMSFQGFDETASDAPTTPTALDIAGGPYVFHDCVLTVAGTEYAFRQFSLSVSNALEMRHNNSITPTSIHATDRQVQVSLGLPYGEATALYGSALGGVAVVATFTNGSRSLVMTMPKVQAPKQGLEFGTRAAMTLPWTGIARRDGSTAELTITNDSTV